MMMKDKYRLTIYEPDGGHENFDAVSPDFDGPAIGFWTDESKTVRIMTTLPYKVYRTSTLEK